MLDAAGGINVFSDVKRQSIQTTSELAVARAPDVILEIGIDTASTTGRNLAAWNALPSIPAVRNKRIYQLRGDGMMNPDKLHPALPGYQVWADGLRPLLTELLGPPAATDHAPPPTGDPSATTR